MLVDANILLYSLDEESPFHRAAQDWVVEALNGPRRKWAGGSGIR